MVSAPGYPREKSTTRNPATGPEESSLCVPAKTSIRPPNLYAAPSEIRPPRLISPMPFLMSFRGTFAVSSRGVLLLSFRGSARNLRRQSHKSTPFTTTHP